MFCWIDFDALHVALVSGEEKPYLGLKVKVTVGEL